MEQNRDNNGKSLTSFQANIMWDALGGEEHEMVDGYAVYDESSNRLEVVRPNETTTRYIRCNNLRPEQERVFGVQVMGDEIWVLTGPRNNQRPNKKLIYSFSSLSGGASRGL